MQYSKLSNHSFQDLPCLYRCRSTIEPGIVTQDSTWPQPKAGWGHPTWSNCNDRMARVTVLKPDRLIDGNVWGGGREAVNADDEVLLRERGTAVRGTEGGMPSHYARPCDGSLHPFSCTARGSLSQYCWTASRVIKNCLPVLRASNCPFLIARRI